MRTLVVVGHGMVAHHLIETMRDRRLLRRWRVVVFGEEPRRAYDRVALSSLFADLEPADLTLDRDVAATEASGVEIVSGDAAVSIDRDARTVATASGREVAYDAAVLATGSYPFVPPVPGTDLPGVFTYRTVDDVEAMKAWAARPGVDRGAVLGGGLLGLEAAQALLSLGLETDVVEFAPRLMPQQVDEGGGAVLAGLVSALGPTVHTGAATEEIVAGGDGCVASLRLSDGSAVDAGMVVVAAGIRPRDGLARSAGLEIADRGGVVVDAGCTTSDPCVYAIGECAHAAGRTWGLVAPGYRMAEVVADRLAGGDATFAAVELNTKLKLLGVDVASVGSVQSATHPPGAEELTYADPLSGVYKKLVLSADGTRLHGAVLVGDATGYGALCQMLAGTMPVPERPESLILPGGDDGATIGVTSLADEAVICSCHGVTKAMLCTAIDGGAICEIGELKAATKAATGCGGCAPLVADVLHAELDAAGIERTDAMCEHFEHSRQELFDIVRTEGIATFADLLARHGHGRGCEVCRPAVASIFASLGVASHVLDGEHAALQDTNDHFLANIQKDGTYSVVPRIPGGEIAPEKLIVLGEVARDFGLYTKITGGQRVDLFGARVDQLPAIWQRLIDAGFESGHAYAKALRTVKSCVGSTWCRYGVQDSVTLAIDIELRYRGLRAPHKIKGAVAGCTRDCSEAKIKDFGVIATDAGWSLYVCGNGGMVPRVATLFAEDLDRDTLLTYLDRFLMFYVRTADRLERTATWFAKRPGGIEELRRILVDDELGICSQLEAEMERHVDSYRCEWRAALEDPSTAARFVSFVNAPDAVDPEVVFVPERGQIRPARPEERFLSGPTVEVELS